MQITKEAAFALSDSLVSEDGQMRAPRQVLLPWLALSDGDAGTATYCYVVSQEDGTAWTVLGVRGSSLLVLRVSSPESLWSAEDEEVRVSITVDEAVRLPMDQVQRVELTRAVERASRMPTADFVLTNAWKVVFSDGRSLTLPARPNAQPPALERLDSFIAALTAARFGPALGD